VRSLVLDLAVDQDGRDGDGQDGERRAPTPGERHGEAEDDEAVDPARHANRLEHRLELGREQQRCREHDVEERRGQA
jgi:hypothetical protein